MKTRGLKMDYVKLSEGQTEPKPSTSKETVEERKIREEFENSTSNDSSDTKLSDIDLKSTNDKVNETDSSSDMEENKKLIPLDKIKKEDLSDIEKQEAATCTNKLKSKNVKSKITKSTDDKAKKPVQSKTITVANKTKKHTMKKSAKIEEVDIGSSTTTDNTSDEDRKMMKARMMRDKIKKKKLLKQKKKEAYSSSSSDTENDTSDTDEQPRKQLKPVKRNQKAILETSDSSLSSSDIKKKQESNAKKRGTKEKIEDTTTSSSEESDTSCSKDSASDSDSDIDTCEDKNKRKKEMKKRNNKKKQKKSNDSSDNEDKDDLTELNNAVKLTCRDLKIKKPYTLLEIKWSKQSGRTGPYKICTAKLQYKKKILTVKLPTPIANYEKKQKEILQQKLKKKQNPIFTVLKITQKKSPNFKGKYDFVESQWS
ncbi:protein starmaker-like [Frankliniella occidentalis]|uniref:Protein starmaker-like n=1 Tax=Frankliniella occidentalis TaxID=133901 RepID=A0A9C6U0F5_FRAOC|nr:protein starmaker-like [Frankliniella occidentalis]XP_052121360.1 protein starmaker-like [Frankliniella occidentalis]